MKGQCSVFCLSRITITCSHGAVLLMSPTLSSIVTHIPCHHLDNTGQKTCHYRNQKPFFIWFTVFFRVCNRVMWGSILLLNPEQHHFCPCWKDSPCDLRACVWQTYTVCIFLYVVYFFCNVYLPVQWLLKVIIGMTLCVVTVLLWPLFVTLQFFGNVFLTAPFFSAF